MRIWYTADLHIGDAKVAAARGYDDPDVHDIVLANNWDRCVRPEDLVWVCGDTSRGGGPAQRHALHWLGARPGRKRLIAGNHDSCHPMHRDSPTWLPRYLEVFETVTPYARVRINGHSVLLSHLPYESDHTPVPRFDQYRLRDLGEVLIHGHIHSSDRVRNREIHVGLDAWNLKPVSGQVIEPLVNSIIEARVGRS